MCSVGITKQVGEYIPRNDMLVLLMKYRLQLLSVV